jgi:hypothetical protein
MYGSKPAVRYSKAKREQAAKDKHALITLDVDMRHLESTRVTMQGSGDPEQIITLRTAVFAALLLHDPNWNRPREEGDYEQER